MIDEVLVRRTFQDIIDRRQEYGDNSAREVLGEALERMFKSGLTLGAETSQRICRNNEDDWSVDEIEDWLQSQLSK